MRKEMKSKTSKNPLVKYLICGAAAGSLALSPFAAQAQMGTTQMDTTMTTSATTSDPMLVTGTVDNYWVDRSGYVTAMSVRTATGTEIVRFSPSQARQLYTTQTVGSPVSVWVTPGEGSRNGRMYWDARGLGAERPRTWYSVNPTTDINWLEGSPYTHAGAQQMSVSGNLKGVILGTRGEVIALAIQEDNNETYTIVRVPPELRHVARGHIGSPRVAPLFSGVHVRASGVPEAPRWGVLTRYNNRLAANTIAINGKHAGAVGIQTTPTDDRDALLSWDIGGVNNDGMIDAQARELGYGVYRPVGEPMGENMGSMTTMSTMTTGTTTELATGRVMIVTADNMLWPVVQTADRRVWVRTANNRDVELAMVNGKYVVPASLMGARMQMVMADGRRMEMDTVNGQLSVVMADGTTAPVTLHTR